LVHHLIAFVVLSNSLAGFWTDRVALGVKNLSHAVSHRVAPPSGLTVAVWPDLSEDTVMADTRNDVGSGPSSPASRDANQWLSTPEVYEELRRLARVQMGRQRPSHTLSATALVHEAYLRLRRRDGFNDHVHAVSAGARAMRSVLIDHARSHATIKRDASRRTAVAVEQLLDESAPFWAQLEFDELLDKMERDDPELARLMELRYFGGLKEFEIATATGKSMRTTQRLLKLGRLWLAEALG
jgi:RNA polymerase sigma factor (TIGR02999 family)